MNLWDSLSFPFKIQHNRRLIVLAAFLLFVPIFGFLIWMGYTLRLMRHLMLGHTDELPSIQARDDLGSGFAILVASIVYSVPIFILAFLSGFFVGIFFGRSSFSLNLVTILVWLVNWLFSCAMAVGRFRAAAQIDTQLLYSLSENMRMASQALGLFIVFGFFQAIIMLIFIIAFLNLQYIVLFLASWLTGFWIWPLLTSGLLILVFVYVLLNLASIQLETQLAQILGIEAFVEEKGKRS